MRGLIFGECKDKRSTGYDGDITTEGVAFDDDENYRGGWSSLGLVSEGVEQAKQLGIYLKEKNAKFDIRKIVSSDLHRAKETADILAKELKLMVITDARLREADNGELAGMRNEEALKKYPGLFWGTLKADECYPKGESPNQFFARIKKSTWCITW